MGCCWSSEEDRFEDRTALLAKSQPDKADGAKAKFHDANGHYTKPVTATQPPSVPKDKLKVKDTHGGSNGTPKKMHEEVHPTVKTVELLNLGQPPSPPASSPAKPLASSPPRATSIVMGEAEEEEDEDAVLMSLQKRLSNKLMAQDLVAASPPAKEPLSQLMPPRPSPPPHVLKAMKEAEAKALKEAEAKAKAAEEKLKATVANATASPPVSGIDSSTDQDDNDEGESETPLTTSSGNGSGSVTKSKSNKKKKKKGKK